jgi:hypothetical protein
MCLDAADFGPVTITQSVSIVCDGPRGSILQQGADPAVKIQAGAGDAVVLSGLDILGAGNTATWAMAVDIVSARSVVLEHGTISGFTSGVGIAIYCENRVPMTFSVEDTMFSNNGTGLYCQPEADAAPLRVLLHRAQFVGNIEGVVTSSNFSMSPAYLNVSDSLFSMNSNGLELRGGTSGADIRTSTIVDNDTGVNGSTTVHIGSSVLVNTFTGGPGMIVSYGDNQISGTTYSFAFTRAPLQ